VDYVAALTHTKDHYAEIVESLKPQGALACIDDMDGLDAMKLKAKSLSLHWELMFTRSDKAVFLTAEAAIEGGAADDDQRAGEAPLRTRHWRPCRLHHAAWQHADRARHALSMLWTMLTASGNCGTCTCRRCPRHDRGVL
jgi:hypothetical protein